MATATSIPPQERLSLSSDGETIEADLYGRLPAARAAILVHGQNWDASGWRGVAPLFVAQGVSALAVNLRGYAGSTGKTNRYRPINRGLRWRTFAPQRRHSARAG